MKYKYLRGMKIEEWLRVERKQVHGASLVWKALVNDFPNLGKREASQIGNGSKVRIGEDPCIGFTVNYKLYEGYLDLLEIISYMKVV